jgi:Predicted membrane protein
MVEWYLKAFTNYFGFEGRARRKEYWFFFLGNFLVTIGLSLVEGMIGLPGVFSGLFSLVILVPSIAVGIRRLHDTGRSGWWILLGLVPLLNLVLLVLFCFDSEEGSNEWGDNPKLASP